MTQVKRGLLLPALLGWTVLGAGSCGDMGDANDTETLTGALQSFGAFVGPPVGAIEDAPALARDIFATGEPMTAWVMGTNSQIWVTRQKAGEVWDAGWTQLSNNGAVFSKVRPAAVAIHLAAGTVVPHYAIVALRQDGKFYITIRDKFGGTVVQNWAAIPFATTFVSHPAITYVPPSSPIAPRNTLIVVGLGADNKIYWATNTLTNNVYSHAAWTPQGAIHTDTFPFGPAIAPPCNFSYPNPGIFIVAPIVTGGDITYRSTKFNGATWSPWTDMAFGLFDSGPAVATGCGNPGAEVVTFGLGTDDALWFSTVLTGGSPGWTPIGSPVFPRAPSAIGFRTSAGANAVMVGEMDGNKAMVTSTALAH